MVNFSLSVAAILLVFYLYLLAKPEKIKRNPCFLIGTAGLVLAIIGAFFAPWASVGSNWAMVLVAIFGTFGSLIAFIAAVLACYAGKLPLPCDLAEETSSSQ